jgi:hypothetical protein
MNLKDLFSPMSELTTEQRKVSDTVTGTSVALAAILAVASMPLPAQAVPGGRMSGYDLPSRPAPVQQAPAPAPTYQPPAPRPQPAPVQYGTFRAYGPLPEGRVNVRLDNSFQEGSIFGYTIYTQDNGPEGNDQMVIFGPEGRDQVWLNCWVTEEWKSFGPNSEQFIHSVVSQYCDWEG